MIFGPSDAEFHLELEDTKKCIHQKLPKQRDSNGRSVQVNKDNGLKKLHWLELFIAFPQVRPPVGRFAYQLSHQSTGGLGD